MYCFYFKRSEILNAFDNVIPEAKFKLKLECNRKMVSINIHTYTIYV